MNTVDEDVPPDQATTSNCLECGGRVRTNSREATCEDCGLVLKAQRIDHGPDWWPSGAHEGNPRRTGAPLTNTRHDRGLSTTVDTDRTDANGNQISLEKRRRLGRLRRQQHCALRGSKREQNQMYGLMEIRRLTGALGLGDDHQEQASPLFRTTQAADLLRGRSIEAISTAAVYAACRCNGLPQPLTDKGRVAPVSDGRCKTGIRS